jgi:thioredoxin-related protein
MAGIFLFLKYFIQMKNILILFTLTISSIACAQNWETNWEDASAKAKQYNQNIILVFSGSDWCAPCIKLDREIWQSVEFQTFANNHWVLLRADFPRKKENKLSEAQIAENTRLAEKYNEYGYFPLVVLLNADGIVLGKTGYKNISVKEYIEELKTLEN